MNKLAKSAINAIVYTGFGVLGLAIIVGATVALKVLILIIEHAPQ